MKAALRKDGDPGSVTLMMEVESKTWEPDEVKTLCKSAGVKYKAGDEGRINKFCVTSEVFDREEDLIVIDGIDTKEFQTNPVVLWAHDFESIPIGVVLKIEIVKGSPSKMFMTVLHQDVTEFSQDVYELVSLGYIKGCSITFRIKRGGLKFPSEQEKEAFGIGPYAAIITACKLLELSLCPVGMNQEALKVRAFGKNTIALLKGVDPSNISEEDTLEEINMKSEEVVKAIEEGIAKAVPSITAAVLAVVNKAAEPPAKPEVPPIPPPPTEDPKIFKSFMDSHPDLFGGEKSTSSILEAFA